MYYTSEYSLRGYWKQKEHREATAHIGAKHSVYCGLHFPSTFRAFRNIDELISDSLFIGPHYTVAENKHETSTKVLLEYYPISPFHKVTNVPFQQLTKVLLDYYTIQSYEFR